MPSNILTTLIQSWYNMENKHIIILVLIVIIVALLVGIFATMQHTNKQDTNLTFKCNSTIKDGDSIKIQLTDANGSAIANQTVNVTITDKDKSSDYHSVETNDQGIGTLNIDKNSGNYTITITYAGNDNYAGCNATKEITIEEEVTQTQETSNTDYQQNTEKLEFNGKTHEQNVQEAKESRDKGGQWSGATDEEIERMISKEERDGGRI